MVNTLWWPWVCRFHLQKKVEMGQVGRDDSSCLWPLYPEPSCQGKVSVCVSGWLIWSYFLRNKYLSFFQRPLEKNILRRELPLWQTTLFCAKVQNCFWILAKTWEQTWRGTQREALCLHSWEKIYEIPGCRSFYGWDILLSEEKKGNLFVCYFYNKCLMSMNVEYCCLWYLLLGTSSNRSTGSSLLPRGVYGSVIQGIKRP